MGDLDARVPLRDLGEVAEVGDDAVLDDQQPVAGEPGGLLLVPDVLPGIVDEIEERPADRGGFARHRCGSARGGGGGVTPHRAIAVPRRPRSFPGHSLIVQIYRRAPGSRRISTSDIVADRRPYPWEFPGFVERPRGKAGRWQSPECGEQRAKSVKNRGPVSGDFTPSALRTLQSARGEGHGGPSPGDPRPPGAAAGRAGGPRGRIPTRRRPRRTKSSRITMMSPRGCRAMSVRGETGRGQCRPRSIGETTTMRTELQREASRINGARSRGPSEAAGTGPLQRPEARPLRRGGRPPRRGPRRLRGRGDAWFGDWGPDDPHPRRPGRPRRPRPPGGSAAPSPPRPPHCAASRRRRRPRLRRRAGRAGRPRHGPLRRRPRRRPLAAGVATPPGSTGSSHLDRLEAALRRPAGLGPPRYHRG